PQVQEAGKTAPAKWSLVPAFKVILIAIGATIVIRVLHMAIRQLQLKISSRHATTDLEWERRAMTIGGLLSSLVTAAIGFVAMVTLLRELGIDIMPILATAGIVGLAIGFGAQNLVRDVISGSFLILED